MYRVVLYTMFFQTVFYERINQSIFTSKFSYQAPSLADRRTYVFDPAPNIYTEKYVLCTEI